MSASNNVLSKRKRNRRRNCPVSKPITPLPSLITNRCPFEIIEIIVSFFRDDHHTLSICSRVCKAWLTICRDHLFEEIKLHERNFDAFCDLLSSSQFNAHTRSRTRSMILAQDPRDRRQWFKYCMPFMGKFSVTHLLITWLCTDAGGLQIYILETNFQSVTNLELNIPFFQTLALFVDVICGLRNLERLSLLDVLFSSGVYPLKALTHWENRFPQKLQELQLWSRFYRHGTVIYHWLKELGLVLAPVHTLSLLLRTEESNVDMRESFWVTAGHILSRFDSLKHLIIASFGLAATDVLSHNHALLSLRFNNIDLRMGRPTSVRDPRISWQWVPELLDQVISPCIQVVEFEIFINDVNELEALDWDRIARSLSRPQFSHLWRIHFIVSGFKRAAGRRIRGKFPECAQWDIVHISQLPDVGYNE